MAKRTQNQKSPRSRAAAGAGFLKDFAGVTGGAIVSTDWKLVAPVADNEPFSFQQLSIVPRILDGGRVLQLTATCTDSDFTQQAKSKKFDIRHEVEARKRDVEISMKQMADIQERLMRGGGCDGDEVDEDAGIEMARLLATVSKHKREIERLKALHSVTVRYSERSVTRSFRLEACRMMPVPPELFTPPLAAASIPVASSSSSSSAGCRAASAGSAHEPVCWMWVPEQAEATKPPQLLQIAKHEKEVTAEVPLLKIGGVELKYVSDFDGNGLFHYLGTARGKAAWRNPVESGAITVTPSHVFPSKYPVSRPFNRNLDGQLGFTFEVAELWIRVDLGVDTLIANVTHVTLGRDQHSWKLEGSRDGSAWELLKRVGNSDIPPPAGSTCQLPGTSAPARFLRFTMGRRRHDVIPVWSLEVYGLVMTP